MKSRRLMNRIKPAVMSLLVLMLIWTQLIMVPDPGFAEGSHTDSHPAVQIGDGQQWDGDPAAGEPAMDQPGGGRPGSGHEEVLGDGSGDEGTPGGGSEGGKAPASGEDAKAPAAEDAVIAVEPGNLAAGKNMTASSYNQTYAAGNANDSNQATYWESSNNAFPQWLQVDLGSSYSVNKVILKLPANGWETRSQTLTVQGSSNGSAFNNLSSSAAYTFNPADGNKVTINLTAQSARYVRLLFTANTAWPAGQISEFEVYGQAPAGDTEAPTAPGNLAYTEPASGQIKLTWSASADNVGVTGYDIYANQAVRASVAGNVLTYTDNQPAAATVSYYVKAKDAAGNVSAASNTVTRTGSGGGGNGTNLALNKPITASSNEYIYAASNANDGSLSTYWEGSANRYPHTLTVDLGSNADISSVVLKLNPDSQWGTRAQTIQVLGHDQNSNAFTNLVSAAQYTFNPATGNTVTIPVTAKVNAVQLRITANTGSSGGQIAEFQVIGTPASNPDLTITGMSWTPVNPVETDSIVLTAVVKNIGTLSSGATTVNFYHGNTKLGTSNVAGLAAGASANVTLNLVAKEAGTYQLTAKVDENNAVMEQNEANNSYTHPTSMVISPVQSSDLVAATSWSPGNPAAGNSVNFTVTVKNQGTAASAGGAHGIKVTLSDANTNNVIQTFTGTVNGVIASGASAQPVNVGSWTAANGKYNVKTEVAVDANELPVKQANNIATSPLFIGRGANMPYDMYEAEDAVVGGGAAVVGPNRNIGDIAGEASGRKAVTLHSTGSFVEFTTKASTNSLVTRFSIPDAPGGGGIDATLNVYVDGVFTKTINLTSKYAWLYGDEANPSNSPSAGAPRHIYDEANIMFDTTIPKGSKIRLQKDAANTSQYAIDFINLEQVTLIPNPDPAKYVVPAGFTHQDVQNALDKFRMDTTGNLVGVYLPAGTYQTSNKFQVYGKPVKIVGAGPWFTRFTSPSSQNNTDIGFSINATANGSTFANFAYFGNYTSRIDGPGKVFDFSNVANMTIDNIWVEHQVCMYWGANTDYMKITNSRIRNVFADGINMTNGSTNNLVSNIEARATGDDSFALFSAIDAGGADEKDNVYENLTSLLTWRAAGLAVYGGYGNTFRNIYIADTLCYSGVTISSLDFGYPMNGFGASPPTQFENISIVRAGGHFWNQQTFPAMWLFSASKVFQGIRVTDVDIIDPTYHGIMFQTNYVGGQPQNPVKDTIFTNITISGAKKSGDAFDVKSGVGIWANEMPEPNQGPAVGSVIFNNLKITDTVTPIKNNTSTFTIQVNP
ncbi:hypothetical protein PVOR_04748 [Paenibacillus vortex V453]|uniref:F5/8 type C domain-containing protein n=1 Tax=Paenibacillus vortex V453 TaxID=715225 RepID=A0A2R9T0D1_9BACL|nr:discoidin domain-containing protein [Paenibacillus vortex]EFU43048.1 hypothetical protein PVOR_04748 [Paenibacillus vortex V453]